jgi:hypothetical protein
LPQIATEDAFDDKNEYASDTTQATKGAGSDKAVIAFENIPSHSLFCTASIEMQRRAKTDIAGAVEIDACAES